MTNNNIEDKEHTHKNEPHIHGGKYIGEKKDG
ncbi:MAG: phosphatidylinositol kinase, partial [Clostridium cochlearium]|nr:phosphatidylinositol kinase [Clostridium cochlearium]